MTRTKPTMLAIGSISTGTLRVEDILPAVLDALGDLRLTREERAVVMQARGELEQWEEFIDDPDEGAREDLETTLYVTLFDIADAHCPDYCYFGGHPGDGADIGVWPAWDSLSGDSSDPGYTGGPEGDGYVSDARDTAGPGHTHALEVNDHGNATLYRRVGTRWVECWSIV